MARNRKQSPRDIGTDSPPSESAKKQMISGYKGGPQGERPHGTGKQPPQPSGRRSKVHEPPPEIRKSFAPEEDPSLQGGPPRSPERVKESPSLQGLAGRSHSGGTRADDMEEVAQHGPPRSTHTRHGRQKLPGDRSR